MSTATDLTQCTATDLLDLYRRGEASPVEATRAVLERIENVNPAINAFCLVEADAALASAATARPAGSAGEPFGSLDGVATSIKDLILTRGWPTSPRQLTVDPDQPWDVDAPATARLREAGAVLLGKTTTPEFGCKGETNSPMTGITRNPWDPSEDERADRRAARRRRWPPGLAPLAVGTDGAGIRAHPGGVLRQLRSQAELRPRARRIRSRRSARSPTSARTR